jgi:ribonuclease HI
MKDEMHMLFLCPFSKAAWFCNPWFIKTESFAAVHHSIPDMINALLSSNHPHINTKNLYTFLWCLWKSRNDTLFGKKIRNPAQLFATFNAILQGSNLEGMLQHADHTKPCEDQLQHIRPIIMETQAPSFVAGCSIFCDAAWKLDGSAQEAPAGIGIYIQVDNNQHFKQLHIAAMSPPVGSTLQAGALALVLATKLAVVIQLQEPQFFTDSTILAQAASTNYILSAMSHWEIRPQLATIQASSSFQANRVKHISRSLNVKAHHLARLATRINSTSVAIRCLCQDVGLCPGRDILSDLSLNPFKLLSVKCC